MLQTVIPQGYAPCLNLYDTQKAIGLLKRLFEDTLGGALHLRRVSAPLFVEASTGLNDDLNGVERAVSFDIPDAGRDAQVVHSLAKWKRMALYRYQFSVGEGLYTDMNAIRRDEDTDNIHSIYVDQWDWEKVIRKEERTRKTLEDAVRAVYKTLKITEDYMAYEYEYIGHVLPDQIVFVTAQELEDRYPALTPREREYKAAREYGAIFIEQIGKKLASGKPHDGRAPDYDDWELNGDIIVYYPILDIALELSSMGIRVDEDSLRRQLAEAGCEERAELAFQKALLNGELPYTIGGGIGQSRICMFFLRKAHIGEIQASIWPADVMEAAGKAGIPLL